MRLTYETPNTGFGYDRGVDCEGFEFADRPALDRLVAAVHARKLRRGTQSSQPRDHVDVVPMQNVEPFVVPVL